MYTSTQHKEKILLHACCGPCSIEPYKVLLDKGYQIHIFYSNSNIYPYLEYKKRYETLKNWASKYNIEVTKEDYNFEKWFDNVDLPYKKNNVTRSYRCFLCYKTRLDIAAKYACLHSFDFISTTLSVSPYQNTKYIETALLESAKKYDIKPLFFDFRKYYKQSIYDSKSEGMYRQKYCGCQLSMEESEKQLQTQILQKIKKKEEKKKKDKLLEAKRIKNLQYQNKKKRQKELLRQYKNKTLHL